MKRFALLLCCLLSACAAKEQASDLNAKSDIGGTDAALLTSGVVVDDLCRVAERCRNVKAKSCAYQVSKQTGVPDALGAPYGRYSTVHDLTTGLEKREIAVNESALDLCRVELVRVACGSELVTEAFGTTGGASLENIERLLRVNALCEKLIRVY